MIYPSLKEVKKITTNQDYKVVPISMELYSDIKTPIETLKILKGISTNVFILESVDSTNKMGRYTFLGYDPKLELTCYNHKLKITTGTTIEEEVKHPNEYIRKILKENKSPRISGMPTFTGGLVGYFSYDYGREQMEVPSGEEELVKIPEAVWTFYDCFIIEDRNEKKTYLVANGITNDAWKQICEMEENILKLWKDAETYMYSEDADDITIKKVYEIKVHSNFEKEPYKRAISQMIRYIIEGDIYIANMTRHLMIESDKPPLKVFYDLRKNNPSPFGAYMDLGEYQIVCASPERFLKMKDHHVTTRPIKGTRKRGCTPEEDAQLRQELQQSEKDKSELLMIVDLERNDLNRVCKPGSVKVTELFTVEEYATVFHLVSNIKGELEEEKNAMDLLEAAFPGGSITGAPKYRAMEIIDELEHGKRNLYTGSIGYLTLDGSFDLNIVIRTALHKDGRYYLGVGGGITAESELEFEYEETMQKAKAILDALQ